MDINVRHIFKSDLDPNSTAWWSKDKIDKINYNFGLLSLGGSEGPLGKPGSNGSVGDPGTQGFEGSQGFDGAQGAYGTPGAEPWKKVKHPDADFSTILPKYNGLPEDETDVTRVIFSDYISGYTDTDGDGQMDSGDILVTENSPVDFYDAIWGIYTQDPNLDNLEFRSSDNSNKSVIDLRSDGSDDILEIYSDTEINFKADGLLFNDYEKIANWLTVNNNEFKTNIGSQDFDDSVRVTSTFKYQNNPVAGHILAAINSDGDVEWKNKLQVFDGLPVGSVISIPASYFNSDNFELNRYASSVESNQAVFNLIYGRGKDKFTGWYLCNGKDWTNGTDSYEVPNLNSFTYNIAANSSGQPQVVGGSDTPIVIGGAAAYVTAQLNQSNEYESDITITTTDEQITLTPGTTGYYLSRNVHIVYLELDDLSWGDDGIAYNEDPGNGGSVF